MTSFVCHHDSNVNRTTDSFNLLYFYLNIKKNRLLFALMMFLFNVYVILIKNISNYVNYKQS